MEDERWFRPYARLRVRFPAVVVNPKFSQFRHELNQVDLAGVVAFADLSAWNVMPAFATLERTRAVTQRLVWLSCGEDNHPSASDRDAMREPPVGTASQRDS